MNAGASTPEATLLVDGIQALLDAVRTVRKAGMSVELPASLVRVCQEVVDEHAAVSGSSPHPDRRNEPRDGVPSGTRENRRSKPAGLRVGERRTTGKGAERDPVLDLPLRRQLWQVLLPGDTVTVTEVVKRLAEIGVSAESSKVSNALGYWVDRLRLVRERKGVYHFPEQRISAAGDTSPAAGKSADTHIGTGNSVPDLRGRADQTERRYQSSDDQRTDPMVREQEDSSGDSPTKEEGGRRHAV